MEKTSLIKLDLRTSIIYTKDITSENGSSENIEIMKNNEEILHCYRVNPKQYRNFEPDFENFLGNLIFTGRKAINPDESTVSLPEGLYLFVQCRDDKPLKRDEWLDLAIEQQKDGLWERHKLSDLVYIRFLYEDGKTVTQVFRPIVDDLK
jgi:hypothetical protein